MWIRQTAPPLSRRNNTLCAERTWAADAIPNRNSVWLCVSLLLGVAALEVGCTATAPASHRPSVAFVEPPREKVRASLATERIKVTDVLQFRLPDNSKATLNGTYEVAPDGTIEISGSGKIQVAGKTMEEAQQAIRQALAASAAMHEAFELTRYEYYLVTVTPEGVQDLARKRLKGKVAVRDALKDVPALSGKVIWIARPMPGQSVKDQVLAVDADAIAHGDSTPTNYYLQPGDFLFIADEPVKGVGRVFDAVTALFGPAP